MSVSDLPRGREVTRDEATTYFSRLDVARQLGTLHPAFVEADASRAPDLHPRYWVFQDGSRFWLHSIHVSPIEGTSWSDAQSPYGYGGPLSNTVEPDFLARAQQAFSAWAVSNDIVAEFVRFHPVAGNDIFFDGTVREDRETVMIELRGDLFAGYQKKRRPFVRQALRSGLGWEFASAERFLGFFPEMYAANMRELGASEFYFFPQDYFTRVVKLPFASPLLVLDEQGSPCAGALLLVMGDTVEYHLGARLATASAYAMSLLFHVAAEHFGALNCRYMYLGGGRSRAPDDSLLFFKKSFGRHSRPFRIGQRVYDEAAYAELKVRFAAQFASHPGRVLFYRGSR